MARLRKKTRAQVAIDQRVTDLEAVNLPAGAATLPQQSSIEITRTAEKREGRAVTDNSARRLDAFDALKAGMADGAYDAARRLERDILTRLGLTDRAPAIERVDGQRGRADLQIMAGERVDAVADRMPPRDFWLLTELIAPAINRGTWRDHVKYITGEAHTEAQSACVRAACLNLRDAYAAVERRTAA